MIKVKEDLTGKRFGRWTVLKRVDDITSPSGKVFDMWMCKCSCKNETEKVIYGTNLRGGKSSSCGCLPRENRHKNCLKNNNHYDDSHNGYMVGYTKNNEPFYFDEEDYNKIKNFVWYIGKDGYVVTHNPNKHECDESKLIRMHRLVLDLTNKNVLVDHKNRIRNDNRKENLRVATAQQNSMNSSKQSDSTYSKFKGVCYHKNAGKWVAYISINGIRKHLGIFDTELEAAKAYEDAANKYFKEYACTEPRKDGMQNVC